MGERDWLAAQFEEHRTYLQSVAHRMLGSTMTDAEEALGPDHPHVQALIECGESNGLLRREV